MLPAVAGYSPDSKVECSPAQGTRSLLKSEFLGIPLVKLEPELLALKPGGSLIDDHAVIGD